MRKASPPAPAVKLDKTFWRNVELLMPADKPKIPLDLPVDRDVVQWFKRHGRGHATRMSVVLRAYYMANRNRKKAS